MEGELPKDELNQYLNEHGHLQTRFEQLGGYTMRSDAAAALSGLGFSEADFQKTLGEFSGGWQMRGALARVLISHPDALLLDEPSNYLDISRRGMALPFFTGFYRDIYYLFRMTVIY